MGKRYILEIYKRRISLFADHVMIYLSKINQSKIAGIMRNKFN